MEVNITREVVVLVSVLFCFLVKYIQAASMLLFSKDLAFKGIKNLDIFVKELIR